MDILIQAALVTLIWLFVAVCIVCCCFGLEAAADGRRSLSPGSQHRRPAPARVVVGETQQLAYFSYPADPEEDRGTAGASVVVCAICLEALVGGAECSEVPACRHVFHRGCLAPWMKGKSTCPLCRRPVVPGSEPLSAAEALV